MPDRALSAGAGIVFSGVSPDPLTISAAFAGGRQVLQPVGLYGLSLTAVTALGSNSSLFLYVGKADGSQTTADVLLRVTTAAATITWAEVAFFVGTFNLNGSQTLTRVGFTNVAAVINSVGIKRVTVALAGVQAGDDLFVACGSQATTPAQFRGLLADDLQSGAFTSGTGRLSTLAAGFVTTLAANTAVPAWLRVLI